ncbi:pectin lyase fold/virulence factor [Lophiotrema nucula]|uniref:Pectin lyase fold/virulence factor n=1 Tax=Lophiotrema nucula TaxID=690887 RepID=A0A6A5YQQ1_9PLEO|nr:pectin lyase fold/virulence factor [Lophiotrema nucula]
MKYLIISISLSLFGGLCQGRSDVRAGRLEKRKVCQVHSEGYESIDDAPAINAAIQQCGRSGTIILPDGQLYSIRSPIDLSPCYDCEVQLEGQLWLSNDPALFADKPAFISISEANGVTLRSLSGKGVIEGRATTAYQRYRLDDPWATAPPMINIFNSTNIVIDNVQARNIIKRFYMVDGKSSNIRLTNLLLTVENQWWQEIWTRAESIGFHIRNASSVTLENITANFQSDRPKYKVGICAGIDYATDSITIKNIYCNTGGGAMIQFGTGGPPNTIPLASQQYATNILISNYTANATDNTGFQNLVGYDDAYVRNLTYDGVDIIATSLPGWVYVNALVNDLCTVVNNTKSDKLCSGWMKNTHANFSDVWFKNYEGNVDLGVPSYGHTKRTQLDCGCWHFLA